MAKFRGKVGFSDDQTESAPGVFVDQITERKYSGNVLQNQRQLSPGDQLNEDLSVQNSISIVADAYGRGHMFAIRYVEWAGTRWTVTSVEVQQPRLILRLGKVYNGPIPT